MIVLIGTLLVFIIAAAFHAYNSGIATGMQRRRPVLIRDLQTALEILKKSTLESRAKPNTRLVTAFGIQNAFTTRASNNHRSFMAEVKDLIRIVESEDWRAISDRADRVINGCMGEARYGQKIQLAPLVQHVVLRMVLALFFGIGLEPQNEDVGIITEKINTIWLLSKHPEAASDPKLVEQKTLLHAAIKRVFSLEQELSISPSENPLNIILLAYETLWRVVLRCFLEVCFRSPSGHRSHYGEILRQLCRDPTIERLEVRQNYSTTLIALITQFGQPDNISDTPELLVSVRDLVSEALRLYPPTRRIHRELSWQSYAIDVEFLHRAPTIWGDTAMEFRPERWSVLEHDGDILKAYMPFSAERYFCPAAPHVAPMLIGVLVAVLFKQFDGNWKVDGEEFQAVMSSDEPLEGSRDGLEGLQLVREHISY